MPDSNDGHELHFLFPFDEGAAHEASARGYLSHVVVRVGEDEFPVTFYDSVRLAQDIVTEAEFGRPFLATAGMIVVREVTLRCMTDAIAVLYREGYFDHFIPMDPSATSGEPSLRWPPPRQ